MSPEKKNVRQVPGTEVVVDVKDLRVLLDGREILSPMSFSLTRNSITILIGPNGSGKTTLIRALMGLTPLAQGTVRLFGEKPNDIRQRIGYVPQRFGVDPTFPITVEEFLSLTFVRNDVGRTIGKALSEVGMESQRDALLSSLSGGQLQRVLVARALLGKPQLLFLDEPLSNVDVLGSTSIYEHLDFIRRRYDITIIIVSHEMDVVSRYADMVLCVNRELVCSGTPHEVLDSKELRHLYGEELKHFHHHS